MPQTFITTSWDDGHPLDMRIAEMLDKYGLTGTFYIPRTISTGVMTDAQLRDLASRFEIGAHTLNHVFLTDTSPEIANQEISGSRRWVEDATGRNCSMFCPPAGKYTREHLPMFTAAGFTGIRTVEFFSLDKPRLRGGIVEMPTTLQAHPQTFASYTRNIAKRRRIRNFWLYTFHGHSRHWPTLAQRLLDRAVASGGVFHLWGHSWEIEAASQWVEVDRVLRQLGEVVAAQRAICLTNGQVCQSALGARSMRTTPAAA